MGAGGTDEEMLDVEGSNKVKTDEKRDSLYFQNIGGKFLPISLTVSQGASRSRSSATQSRLISDQCQSSKFPNISVLKHLINVSSIQKYPRLALLVFDALLPFMEIFDNQLISFTEICQE
jgi:hypothetical protein